MTDIRPTDLEELIVGQLRVFETDEQRSAFRSFAIEPLRIEQRWSYGGETHACFVVARSQVEQVVYCGTGFGPAFPWSVQRIGTADLGTDGQWSAYLFECFVSSSMWPHPTPENFELKGPGERAET
jgi:hypothetical protein